MTRLNAIPITSAWKFCPRCGAAVQQTDENPFRCTNPDCGYVHYFSPHTAVGGLILDSGSRMLFIVRGRDPGRGKLGLPGGFVDAGESAEEALRREIEEEINLNITSCRYLASFPNRYGFQGIVTPVTDLFFVARVQSFETLKVQEGEIEAWRFLPVDDVQAEELAFETHQQALEAYSTTTAGRPDEWSQP